jgi:pimeloyl-ACP methyl ester carboxylesterase
MARVDYHEFSMFQQNAAEWSLPFSGDPDVVRVEVEVAPGRSLSALRWGTGTPEVVLLHGGAQNAHTYDTVSLALNRPLLAVDLPSHGHSDEAPGGHSDVAGHVRDVGALLVALGLSATPLVGMSLGGLVAIGVTAGYPAQVSKLGLIDITPGVTPQKAEHITSFVSGPRTFANLDEILARTIEHNPTRSEQSLRRGVLHNAMQLDDGSWIWRHQRFDRREDFEPVEPATWWDALSSVQVPVLLVRAMGKGSVVDDDDERELLRRQPAAHVVRVEHSGHSVQGDQPVVLASVLGDFLDG